MQPGDKDGYGRYGHIEETVDGLLCHECGKHYRSLAAHAYGSHGMTADQYRAEHGIPQRVTLITGDMRTALSEASTGRIGTDAWKRLEEARNPTTAARARTPESFQRRGEDRQRQIETAKRNIAGVRKPITRRCKVCGALIRGRKDKATCSPLCGRIDTYRAKSTAPAEKWAKLHDDGHSWSEIGRAYGVSHTNIRVTVHRYKGYLEDVAFLEEYGPGEVPEKRT